MDAGSLAGTGLKLTHINLLDHTVEGAACACLLYTSIRDVVLVRMSELRMACDEAETLTAKKYWPFPTYGELLFGIR